MRIYDDENVHGGVIVSIRRSNAVSPGFFITFVTLITSKPLPKNVVLKELRLKLQHYPKKSKGFRKKIQENGEFLASSPG
jgi:hypothetical protein